MSKGSNIHNYIDHIGLQLCDNAEHYIFIFYIMRLYASRDSDIIFIKVKSVYTNGGSYILVRGRTNKIYRVPAAS